MFEIRKATIWDFDSIALLHADSWRKTYRGIYSEKYLDEDVVQDRLNVWKERFHHPASNQQVFVAIDAGIIVGFACIFIDDHPEYGTLLDNLHVSFEHQKAGIGKALMKQCAKHIIATAQKPSLYLWVYDSNENARKTYAKLGGTYIEKSVKINEDGSESPMWRCVWPDVHLLIGSTSDDYHFFTQLIAYKEEKYEFNEIERAIEYHYPLNVGREDRASRQNHIGWNELSKKVVAAIHDDDQLLTLWTSPNAELSNDLGKPIFGTTYAQNVALSAFVLLEEVTLGNHTRRKKIHFFVSLVGKFYTVIGEDENHVIVENVNYVNSSYAVVSPEFEFAEVFLSVSSNIERRFPGYRFVPCWIYRQVIEGLYLPHTDEDVNTVFDAIFGRKSLESHEGKILGDPYFRSADWMRPGFDEESEAKWTAYPPGHKFEG